MDFSSAGALLAGTLSIAALHALIPSHWLAFAVVGRAQRWPKGKTLSFAALAGAGHVLFTVALGLVLVIAGKIALKSIPPMLEHGIAASLLILLGLYFLLTPLLRRGGHHAHTHCQGDPMHAHISPAEALDGRRNAHAAMVALVIGLTLSPCLDLLPIYVTAAAQPWSLILALSLVMAIVTLATMLTLVWLALNGLERLNLRWLERYEPQAVGVILVLLGVVLLML